MISDLGKKYSDTRGNAKWGSSTSKSAKYSSYDQEDCEYHDVEEDNVKPPSLAAPLHGAAISQASAAVSFFKLVLQFSTCSNVIVGLDCESGNDQPFQCEILTP